MITEKGDRFLPHPGGGNACLEADPLLSAHELHVIR